jgi:CheY-like chemotaxis protein
MAKVLLVEDDDIMVDLLSTLLQIEGFEVASVREQDDTLDIIRRETPDVVLLDVHLRSQTGQDVDGFELLKQIRSDEEFGATKVIMSSGIDFQEKCQQAGANAFILKPYMPNALITLIKQTID